MTWVSLDLNTQGKLAFKNKSYVALYNLSLLLVYLNFSLAK